MSEQSAPKRYGAIGSERKTIRPVHAETSTHFTGHSRRPSSWQDEIGHSTPNVPKSIGKLEPFELESPRSPQRYVRSTSFPESGSPLPNLQLTQVRSHGQPLAYEKGFSPRARDLEQTGLIPPSTEEEDFTAAGAKPDSAFSPALQSPRDPFPLGVPQQPRSPIVPDVDMLTYSFDSLSVRESFSRSFAYYNQVTQPHGSAVVSPPAVRDDSGARREVETPSPVYPSSDVDWETNKRPSALLRRPLSSRAPEFVHSPATREQMNRRAHSLLHMPTPQSQEQQRQAQLSEGEMMCLRLRDEVRVYFPESDYPFLNGGPPNFNLVEYPIDVQKVVISLYQAGFAKSSTEVATEALTRQENVYIVVVFKLHRASIYYRPEDMIFASEIKSSDMIVVQADRGEDVGFVWKVTSNVLEAEELTRHLNTEHLRNLLSFVKLYTGAAARLSRYQLPVNHGQDVVFKSIIRKAGGPEAKRLLDKEHDETKAKRIAEQKARERSLPMEILDAEFQADHGKLTIYYISEQYIVFKEFVDDMYKVYKMRVWMSSVNQIRPSR